MQRRKFRVSNFQFSKLLSLNFAGWAKIHLVHFWLAIFCWRHRCIHFTPLRFHAFSNDPVTHCRRKIHYSKTKIENGLPKILYFFEKREEKTYSNIGFGNLAMWTTYINEVGVGCFLSEDIFFLQNFSSFNSKHFLFVFAKYACKQHLYIVFYPCSTNQHFYRPSQGSQMKMNCDSMIVFLFFFACLFGFILFRMPPVCPRPSRSRHIHLSLSHPPLFFAGRREF